MREVYKNVYHLGDSGCSVYLVNTESVDELILIDCGMSLPLIKKISKRNFNPKNINHCIITHCHIDHIAVCHDIKNSFNNNIKFYAHDLDADAIEQKGYDSKTAASWYGVNYKPVKLEKRFKEDLEILNFERHLLFSAIKGSGFEFVRKDLPVLLLLFPCSPSP